MTLDADLDTLYGVAPQEFTALRKELVAAARKRGASDEAKAIAAARRPTAAAWAVNALVRSDPSARDRLGELTAELRAAHSAMDGARIRELSTAQRKLVAELVRAAFAAADLANPGAALRDDVAGTLQAAIADPEVASRLGRLEKAEEWSGFGDFGMSSAVVVPSKPAPSPAPEPTVDRRAVERRRVVAAEALERARSVHAEAVAAEGDRKAALRTARRRYEKLLETLGAAEHDVEVADAELADARTAVAAASDAVDGAKAELAQVDSELTGE